MSHNEQQKPHITEHLLKWLSTFRSNRIPFYCISEIQSDSVLIDILMRIDSAFFQSVAQLPEPQPSRLAYCIESYLTHFLGKTVKPRYRQLLRNDPLALISLALYLAVHCSQNQQFISAILSLSSETQRYLMLAIQHSSQQIENSMEIREILEKVQQLEEENDGLKAELEARRRDAEGLEERVEVLLKDCRELGDEVDGFRREKADVIRDLGLQDIAEYVTMFRRVQAELGDSLREVARLESLTKHLERDKSSYKARIVEDSQLIADLNDELARVKGVCHTLRLSTSFFSLDSSAQLKLHSSRQSSSSSSILKENTLLTNRTSVSFDSDDCYIKLKYEYNEALTKNALLQTTTENQWEALQLYERENSKLRKDNEFYKEQIRGAREVRERIKKLVE